MVFMKQRLWVVCYLVVLVGMGVWAFGVSARGGRAQEAENATLVFVPVADAYVNAEHPDSNYGPWGIIRTDVSPEQRSYLRFAVSGLEGRTVVQATLHLYANGSSPLGYSVHTAGGPWDEWSITFNNQPGFGAALAATGEHGGARVVPVDLTSFVTGEGVIDLVVRTESDKPVSYPSREAGEAGPRLVVEVASSAPPTEVPPTPPPSDVPPTEVPPTPRPTAPPPPTAIPAVDALCGLTNVAWSEPGRLLRGGAPPQGSLACLAAFGVAAIVDQRVPDEDGWGEPAAAAAAGIEYINLGVPDDTAPSPDVVRAWLSTVEARLAEGKLVLVHDRAGRGRMGFWDAVYAMRRGTHPAQAIEERYIGRALPFGGAKIGCGDGGNGQVQALSELAASVTGEAYWPQVDEYGTTWQNCPRPGYMEGWSYSGILP
jgi:hypothetical protein